MRLSVFFSFLLLVFFCSSSAVGQQQGTKKGHQCAASHVSHQVRGQGFGPVSPDSDPSSVLKSENFSSTYVIPVVVHVVHNGGPEFNVTLDQAISQIEVLNEDYGRVGAGFNTDSVGADTKIRFCLASVDPEGNPTTGVVYHRLPSYVILDPLADLTEDTLMKRQTQWDPNRYLNIWTVRRISGGRIFGYAFFPEEVAGSVFDGAVLDYRFFGRGTGTAQFEGRVTTHEIGHYLGLLHPWGDDEEVANTEGCLVDDGCDDTPLVDGEFYASAPNCITTFDCFGGDRMIENYMDYSDDACMNIFTLCQATKMREAIYRYRPQLVSAENLSLSGCGNALDTLSSVSDSILVYPIPATDIVFVYPEFESVEPIEITIYDFLGRKVWYQAGIEANRAPISLNLSGFNMGRYTLIVQTSSRYYRKTIFMAD